eukprot:snap_masked-scaffold_34-processed-gene-0.25-mRNA-1 protein AED:0.36 eAED:0.37 QI:0/-1/0/1/-1/1/1/0/530
MVEIKKLVKLFRLIRLCLAGQFLFKLIKVLLPFVKAKLGITFANVDGKIHDLFMLKLLRNSHRLYHYECEQLLEYPTAHFIKQNMGTKVELVAVNKQAVEFLLRDEFRNFSRGNEKDEAIMELIVEVFGKGTITFMDHTEKSDRLKWLHQRNMVKEFLISDEFKQNSLNAFSDRSLAVVDVLRDISKEGKEAEMHNIFSRYAVDSAQLVLFGNNVQTLEKGMTEEDNLPNLMFPALFSAFKDVLYPTALIAEILPFPFNYLLVYTVKVRSNKYKRLKTICAKMDEYVDKIIINTRLDKKNSNESIAAKFSEAGNLNPPTLKRLVTDLMLAGRDTTFSGLSWMLYELAKNPDTQDKLYQEICERMGERERPTIDDINPVNTPYLNGVILEALRLHPPAPKFSRTAIKDMIYFDGEKNIFIPKGTRIRVSTFSMLRNPKNFSNPLAFKPERWIPYKEISNFEYPIFSAGPRICSGRDMYLNEARVITLILFHKFKFVDLHSRYRYTPVGLISLPAENKAGNSQKMWMKPLAR